MDGAEDRRRNGLTGLRCSVVRFLRLSCTWEHATLPLDTTSHRVAAVLVWIVLCDAHLSGHSLLFARLSQGCYTSVRASLSRTVSYIMQCKCCSFRRQSRQQGGEKSDAARHRPRQALVCNVAGSNLGQHTAINHTEADDRETGEDCANMAHGRPATQSICGMRS